MSNIAAEGDVAPNSPLTNLNGVVVAKKFVLAVATVFASFMAQAVTFTDGTMALVQFSSIPQYTQPGTTISTNQSLDGNPSPGLRTSTGVLSGQTSYFYAVGYVYSAFSYDPSSFGAIATIDFSIDRRIVFTTNGVANDAVIRGRPLIEQNGNFYMAVSAPISPAATGYTHIVMNGLSQASFGRFDYSTGALFAGEHPDFSGSAMHFGFATQAQAIGVATDSQVVLDNFSDNFGLQVTAVPEPETWAVLGAGLLLLRGRGRRTTS